jgi:hypothetical protein
MCLRHSKIANIGCRLCLHITVSDEAVYYKVGIQKPIKGVYMKNFVKWFWTIAFVAIIGFSLVGCPIDDENDVTIDDERIIGKWNDIENHQWEFKSNGKLTYENSATETRSYDYSVVSNKLSFYLTNNNAANDTQQTYNISFSNNGNTLTLTDGKQVTGWSVAGPGMSTNTLTRK